MWIFAAYYRFDNRPVSDASNICPPLSNTIQFSGKPQLQERRDQSRNSALLKS